MTATIAPASPGGPVGRCARGLAGVVVGAVAVLGAATAAAPQIPPEVATAAAVSARGAPSILELAVKGGPLMVPIAACSVVMLALAVERFAGLRRGRVMPQAFLDELQLLAEAPRLDVGRATALCERFRCPMAGMLRAALSRAGRPLSEVEKALEDAAVREIGKLQTAIRWLHFIANVSPLLGLLGTVQGMIVAFIVPSQAGLGKAELLAQGIYMALVTTFAGLVVAIPALTAAHYFGGRVHRLVHEMDELLLPVIPKLGP